MKLKVGIVVGLLLMVVAGGGFWRYQKNNNLKKSQISGENKDKYTAFIDEVYDKVKENYWEKITDQELSSVFQMAISKITNQQYPLKTQDKAGVENIFKEAMKSIQADKKKEFTASLADIVLANLKPFGRSRLYSQKDEKALSNNVNNVNPTTNHFEELGVKKDASDKEIASAFQKKEQELASKAKESTEAAQKLAEVKQAYKVLKNEDSRKIYEVSGVEPTIDYKLMSPQIFYIHMTKFSPTSLEEFARVAAKVDNRGEELDTLILDLGGNIGGAIDGLPYFLGPFIGPDTYAYQFYHQGIKEDFKTVTGWMNSLIRYKKVVIMIDSGSQSTAEVMAAVLKKYNVGVLIGTTSKGWGTVERVFPIEHQIADDEKFSIFLVHRVTLRDDGQPIEGRGVDPMISINSPTWKKELLQRFNVPGIVKAVEEIYKGN
jgi:hypothetical protein